jgi:hypothetical protein
MFRQVIFGSGHSHTSDQEELPVFIITDISGDGRILGSFADALSTHRNNRASVYYYDEPIQNGSVISMSLTQHAEILADEMLRIRIYSPLPYVIIGFSFGGILAAEVSRILQERQYDSRLYVIDQPSSRSVRKYIKAGIAGSNLNLNLDLIKMGNYAASLAGINPHEDKALTIVHTDTDLEKMNYTGLEGRVALIKKMLLEQHPDASEGQKSCFRTSMQVIERNLTNMFSDTKEELKTKLRNTHLILTDETMQKYSGIKGITDMSKGGWDKCSSNVSNITTQYLQKQLHMELMNSNSKLQELPDESAQVDVKAVVSHRLQLNHSKFTTCDEASETSVFNADVVATLIAESLKKEINKFYLLALNQKAMGVTRAEIEQMSFLKIPSEVINQVFASEEVKLERAPLSPSQSAGDLSFFNLRTSSNNIPPRPASPPPLAPEKAALDVESPSIKQIARVH